MSNVLNIRIVPNDLVLPPDTAITKNVQKNNEASVTGMIFDVPSSDTDNDELFYIFDEVIDDTTAKKDSLIIVLVSPHNLSSHKIKIWGSNTTESYTMKESEIIINENCRNVKINNVLLPIDATCIRTYSEVRKIVENIWVHFTVIEASKKRIMPCEIPIVYATNIVSFGGTAIPRYVHLSAKFRSNLRRQLVKNITAQVQMIYKEHRKITSFSVIAPITSLK